MADNIKNKREILKVVYTSKKWSAKVDKMTDAQVVAIYMRLLAQGKI